MLARGRRIDKRREHRPDEGERLARQVRTVPSDPDDRIAASGNESLNAATRTAAPSCKRTSRASFDDAACRFSYIVRWAGDEASQDRVEELRNREL